MYNGAVNKFIHSFIVLRNVYAWRYVFASQYCDVTIESFPSRLTLIDLANQNTYYKTLALEFELRSDFKNVTIIYP